MLDGHYRRQIYIPVIRILERTLINFNDGYHETERLAPGIGARQVRHAKLVLCLDGGIIASVNVFSEIPLGFNTKIHTEDLLMCQSSDDLSLTAVARMR